MELCTDPYLAGMLLAEAEAPPPPWMKLLRFIAAGGAFCGGVPGQKGGSVWPISLFILDEPGFMFGKG